MGTGRVSVTRAAVRMELEGMEMRNRAQGCIQMGSKSGMSIEMQETTAEQSKKY